MAILEDYRVKTFLGLGAGEKAELEAPSGHSYLIRDIKVHGADSSFADFLIETLTSMRVRLNGFLGNHLPFHNNLNDVDIDKAFYNTPAKTILKTMTDWGLFHGFPIAEGEKFTIAPETDAVKLNDVVIIYEDHEKGDISNERRNGYESSEFTTIFYGQPSTNGLNTGDKTLDTTMLPPEFTGFPYEEDVPAAATIDVHGVCACEVIDWDTTNDYTQTRYLKMIQSRKTLFDRDLNGLLLYAPVPTAPASDIYIAEGESLLGYNSAKDQRPPLRFPTPLSFIGGEELKTLITLQEGSAGPGSIDKGYLEVAYLGVIKRE